MEALYFDHHATTPLDTKVLEAMMPYLTVAFGNPSSRSHRFGWQAEAAVEQARTSLATLVAAKPSELVFTSGATESNNLLILGYMRRQPQSRRHWVTAVTEHRSVLDLTNAWQQEGGQVTAIGVDDQGLIDLQELEDACRPQTALISIMAANNEIGVIQPIDAIADIAEKKGLAFHCDAVQAFGKTDLDWSKAHFISLSGHKMYGPKGIGLAVVRRPLHRNLRPLAFGGGQERGLRPGTLNVAGIVGMAKAAELCTAEQDTEQIRLALLRDRLLQGLLDRVPGVTLNGHPARRLANNLNVSIEGIPSDKIMVAAHQLAISSGSACGSGAAEPSHVIAALGFGQQRAKCALRFGLGRSTTQAMVDQAVAILHQAIQQLRTSKNVAIEP